MKFKEDDAMMMRKLGRGITQPKEPVYRTPAITISPITDREGLDKAYALPGKVFVNGDTLYKVGTSYLQDVWDDLKTPFSQTSKAQRYSDAETMMAKNPQIKNMVGHSLGGSTVLELQRNHSDRTFKTNTYGAPVASLTKPDNQDNHRYRNWLDPVSAADKGATSTFKPSALFKGSLNAHSYDNFFDHRISKTNYDFHTDFMDLLR